MSQRRYRCLAAGILVTMAAIGAAAAQSAPPMPDFEAMLAERLAPIQAAHEATMAAYDAAYDQTGKFRTLVLDRVNLTGTYGRGLTLASQTVDQVITDSLKDETNGKWAVTWTLPLSALTQRQGLRADIEQKRAAARVALDAALAKTEWEMRGVFEDYRLARANYQKPPQPAPASAAEAEEARTAILEAGAEMRKLALQLLVLADHRGDVFRRWQEFKPAAPPKGQVLAARSAPE